jgi:hypothetical protein
MFCDIELFFATQISARQQVQQRLRSSWQNGYAARRSREFLSRLGSTLHRNKQNN